MSENVENDYSFWGMTLLKAQKNKHNEMKSIWVCLKYYHIFRYSCKMLSSFRSRFIGISNTDELVSNLLDILPNSEHSYKVVNIEGSVKKFTSTVNCKSLIEPDQFMKDFVSKTNVTLRQNTPKFTKNEFYKQIYFRCQHNTRYQSTMSVKEVMEKNPNFRRQNTNCPFSLALKYRDNSTEYPVVLQMDWVHNHSVSSLQSLSFKDIPDDVSSTIKEMFDNGFTPALAYREFLRKKKEEYVDELELLVAMADRSKVPRRPDFNKLYTDYHHIKYGTLNLDSMYAKLHERVTEKTINSPDTRILYQMFDNEANDPFILVIVTPLMKRVHKKVQTSSELVFFYLSGGMEEYNLRVFLMVTHTPIGALPLGIVITSDETTDTLVRALEMFQTCLPTEAFYGKGKIGPSVIMTDNCSELRDALGAVWSKAVLLLCIFHIMQQVWRWLFEKKHGIQFGDRPQIMGKFKEIVYADEEEEAEEKFNSLRESVAQYRNLLLYIDDLYDIRETWCIYSRKKLMLRGNNTNNYVEAQFLVLKDNVLNRTKEVNINGLVDKLICDFDDHYKTKLLNAASGSFDGIYSGRFKGKSKKANSGVGYQLPNFKDHEKIKATIVQTLGSLYTISSFTIAMVRYVVDMDVGMCNCSVGSDGSVCKHQYFVWLYRHKKSVNFIPFLDPAQRKEYSYIATGKVLPDNYYEGLHDHILDHSPSSTVDFLVNLENQDSIMENEDTSNVNDDWEADGDSNILQGIGRGPVDQWTVEECTTKLSNAHKILAGLLVTRSDDQGFLKGIAKFCDRVGKYQNQPSKLSSALHSFGSVQLSSRKITVSTILQKARRGKKIHVQPGP